MIEINQYIIHSEIKDCFAHTRSTEAAFQEDCGLDHELSKCKVFPKGMPIEEAAVTTTHRSPNALSPVTRVFHVFTCRILGERTATLHPSHRSTHKGSRFHVFTCRILGERFAKGIIFFYQAASTTTISVLICLNF